MAKDLHQFGQELQVLLGVPSRIRGNLVGRIRYQCDLVRLDPQHQVDELLRRIAFDIELCLQQRPQGIHIRIPDMAFVRTRMNRNSFSSKRFAVKCDFLYIGVISPTRIPQGSYLVYIYT